MPIIKSAKKQMKQSRVKRVRNFRTRRDLKEAIKDVFVAVKAGDKKKAQEALRTAQVSIDKAAKKNIIHDNNGARKKSRLAKMVDTMDKKKAAPAAKATKKAAPKKAAPKEEKEVEKAEEVATETKEA